ncbi:hypothetical protein ILYODFUR_019912 [Ilyodon furcidens]|uniref:Peptidase M10 metallopeptidase domain-containing protein n=1 Tax=Ilyodon furcidens TaxID=33524 RepID=A0ABV0T0S1_9TELE
MNMNINIPSDMNKCYVQWNKQLKSALNKVKQRSWRRVGQSGSGKGNARNFLIGEEHPGVLCTPGLQIKFFSQRVWAEASEKSLDVKKRGKVPHPHDLVKEAGLSANTSKTWNLPRCGVPDFPNQKDVQYRERHRQRRFVVHGGRFDKNDLTYKIVRFPWQMDEEQVRRVIREAVKIWSDVTPLTFTEIRRGTPDIRIDFSR